MVYIEEAHPIDAWQDDDNVKAKIFLHSTRTLAERCAVAGTCLTKLGIKFPAIVDDEANTAERAYTAWPDRLYVIDRDGRVAYKSKPGPFGFKPAEVSRALESLLPSSQAVTLPSGYAPSGFSDLGVPHRSARTGNRQAPEKGNTNNEQRQRTAALSGGNG